METEHNLHEKGGKTQTYAKTRRRTFVEKSKPATDFISKLSSGHSHLRSARSEVILDEGQGCQDLDFFVSRLDNLHLLGAFGDAFGDHLGASELGLTLLLVVLLDTLQEGFVASGLPQVSDVDMDAFTQLPVANDLGDLDTQGITIDVKDNASPAVVEGMWHALLDGGVDDNVNIIATFEIHQESH